MHQTRRTASAVSLLFLLSGLFGLLLLVASQASAAAPVRESRIAQATAPTGTLSDPTGKNAPVTLDNPAFKPLGDTTVQGVIGRVIKFILGLTGVIALVMVTYGGFMWMTSAGNTEKVGLAKKTILWSMIGIIVIFSAYALVDFVISAVS